MNRSGKPLIGEAMIGERRWGRATYYRVRADRTRAIADCMVDNEASEAMLQLAALWDMMAEVEERRLGIMD